MNFKELRRGMIVLANTVYKLPSSRELSASRTSLQKAMMWIGTYMKFAELGDNPYAKHDGNRETVKDIDPMFDATAETFSKEIMDKGVIYTSDQMRTYLQEQLDAIIVYMTSTEGLSELEANYTPAQVVHTSLCLTNIYTNLTEARMWLGMELGRIRDEAQ